MRSTWILTVRMPMTGTGKTWRILRESTIDSPTALFCASHDECRARRAEYQALHHGVAVWHHLGVMERVGPLPDDVAAKAERWVQLGYPAGAALERAGVVVPLDPWSKTGEGPPGLILACHAALGQLADERSALAQVIDDLDARIVVDEMPIDGPVSLDSRMIRDLEYWPDRLDPARVRIVATDAPARTGMSANPESHRPDPYGRDRADWYPILQRIEKIAKGLLVDDTGYGAHMELGRLLGIAGKMPKPLRRWGRSTLPKVRLAPLPRAGSPLRPPHRRIDELIAQIHRCVRAAVDGTADDVDHSVFAILRDGRVSFELHLRSWAAALAGRDVWVLDATANEDVLRAIAPDHTIVVEPTGDHTIAGRDHKLHHLPISTTRATLKRAIEAGYLSGYIGGRLPWGRLAGVRSWGLILPMFTRAAFAAALAGDDGADRGLIKMIGQMRRLGIPDPLMLHFGNCRGSNSMKEVDMIVIHTDAATPNIGAAQREAEHLQLDTDEHIEHLRNAELIQALGRGRLVRREGVEVVVVGKTVPGVFADLGEAQIIGARRKGGPTAGPALQVVREVLIPLLGANQIPLSPLDLRRLAHLIEVSPLALASVAEGWRTDVETLKYAFKAASLLNRRQLSAATRINRIGADPALVREWVRWLDALEQGEPRRPAQDDDLDPEEVDEGHVRLTLHCRAKKFAKYIRRYPWIRIAARRKGRTIVDVDYHRHREMIKVYAEYAPRDKRAGAYMAKPDGWTARTKTLPTETIDGRRIHQGKSK